MELQKTNSTIVQDIRTIIDEGRRQAYAAVNATMISTYWNVGRRIVEEEQHGEERAEYGEYIAHKVADALSEEYGNTYNYRNICYFRKFYLCFKDLQIVNARVHNLTWTHFRHLLRVEDPDARLWYMNEAAAQLWSTRDLERNINTGSSDIPTAASLGTSDEPYMLYLPTKEQLKLEIEREKEIYRLQNSTTNQIDNKQTK